MKLKQMILTGVGSALLLTACFENEYYSSLSDNDAFVAFASKTATVSEKDGVVNIPVQVTSVSGIAATVTFEIVAGRSTATEGVSYEKPASFTLSFDGENRQRNISFAIVDNDQFTGNTTVTLRLVEATGVQLGRENSCTVTIRDDEHPLAALLGSWAGTGPNGISGPATLNWVAIIEPDEVLLNKVWIMNLVPMDYWVYPVYGTVDAEMTTLTLPLGQAMYNSGGTIDLVEYTGATNRTGEVVFTIGNGTLTTTSRVGAHSVEFGGYFGLVNGFVLTKQ